MTDIEDIHPGITEAQELIDKEGEPPIKSVTWANHLEMPTVAGEFLTYSEEAAKDYARYRYSLGWFVWINGKRFN